MNSNLFKATIFQFKHKFDQKGSFRQIRYGRNGWAKSAPGVADPGAVRVLPPLRPVAHQLFHRHPEALIFQISKEVLIFSSPTIFWRSFFKS
jgi:hypothetical protein